MAILLFAAGGLQTSRQNVATDPCCSQQTAPSSTEPTPSVVAVSPQEVDVETVSTAIFGYYEAAGGRLTLERAGQTWTLRDADRRVVKSGPLTSFDEIVVSTEIDGPATWCVALGQTGDESATWSADSKGVTGARACPETISYA